MKNFTQNTIYSEHHYNLFKIWEKKRVQLDQSLVENKLIDTIIDVTIYLPRNLKKLKSK